MAENYFRIIKCALFSFLLFAYFETRHATPTSPKQSAEEADTPALNTTNEADDMKNYVVKVDAFDEYIQLESLEDLVTDAIDWAHKIGLVNRYVQHRDRSDMAEIVPFSLFPSPFPRRLFEEAQSLQKALQLLYFRVSRDYNFLSTTLRRAAETDTFLRRQLEILDKAHQNGVIKQKITLLLQRSDYMCHVNKETDQYELKQVEVNIGPIGGNISAQAVRQVHGRVFSKLGLSEDNLPENRTGAAIGEALTKAWELFGDPSAIIVIMSIKNNHGHFALRHIQYEIETASDNKIKVVRLTLNECGEKLILDPNDSSLKFNGRKVAIVYQRNYLYESDWPTEKLWDIRRKIEQSTAIVPLNASIQLAGSKKVQQTLALPGMLEHFLPDEKEEMIKSIRKTFAGLWGLDNDDEITRAVIKRAIEKPEAFVLKTNRDGGGNNFWDEKIAEKLKEMTENERSTMVLMEKLEPMNVQNIPLQKLKEHKMRSLSSELGIVGYFLGDAETMSTIANVQQGHLLRTKFAESREGGVGLGVAVHDSPFLF